MVKKDLAGIIQQWLTSGHDAPSIHKHLVKHGYDSKDVHDTINYVKKMNGKFPLTPSPQPIRGPSKGWLFVVLLIFLGIIILSLIMFIGPLSKTISEEELFQGVNLELKEGEEIRFIFYNEVHTIKISSIQGDSVSLIIQSDPIQIDMKIGEERKIDIDDDGIYDILIKLNLRGDGGLNLFILRIGEPICNENWRCGSWDSCTEIGTQRRSCEDLNLCGTTEDIPFIIQECTYMEPTPICNEAWNCGSWSKCVDEKQPRLCTDLNSCGTTEDKPRTRRSCEPEIIDCGSSTIGRINKDIENFVCFIDASENCEKAKLLSSTAIEFFGIYITSTALFGLEGAEPNKCILSQKIESISVEFSDELVQQLLDDGYTQEEIDEEERKFSENSQDQVGLEFTCKFDIEDLTGVLKRWKEGSFSGGVSCTTVIVNGEPVFDCNYTGDYENAECHTN